MSVPMYNDKNGRGDDDFDDDEILQQYQTGATKFYEIAHYAGYFNVTTFDVLNRLRKSLWPFAQKVLFLKMMIRSIFTGQYGS